MSFNMNPIYDKKINKKDLQRLFWRSIPMEGSWNYERMDNLGFAWAIMPILKKLYPDQKDFADALTRELTLYNVTPYISTFPMAIAAAMEETNSMDSSFNTNSIQDVKTALMGPLSGIGDAFFWGDTKNFSNRCWDFFSHQRKYSWTNFIFPDF